MTSKYRVTGKNLAVGRLIVRGKAADKRLKYIHVGPKGTTVITPIASARVSLPEGEPQPFGGVIIPQASIPRVQYGELELPEGEPAVTGPNWIVPQLDKCFPGPEATETFTCNGEVLRTLLTIACEVSNDSDKTLRLRLCKGNVLRIDTYRQPGDQEFCGTIKGLVYEGDYIPGEMPSDTPRVEKKPVQQIVPLKMSTGRKFRGAGE